ncbi:hypothetical protein Ancab_013451 [Ancistrocladus abbreviatus]
MVSETPRETASMFLLLNFFLYIVVMIVAAWAAHHMIERSREAASVHPLPDHIFPIYFPMGNRGTGFFIIFSLLVGVLGVATSFTGVLNVMEGDAHNLYAAAYSSIITCALTFLAMGLACKEMNMGKTDSNLRALETVMIILSGTQLLCTGALYVGANEAASQTMIRKSIKAIGGDLN